MRRALLGRCVIKDYNIRRGHSPSLANSRCVGVHTPIRADSAPVEIVRRNITQIYSRVVYTQFGQPPIIQYWDICPQGLKTLLCAQKETKCTELTIYNGQKAPIQPAYKL